MANYIMTFLQALLSEFAGVAAVAVLLGFYWKKMSKKNN